MEVVVLAAGQGKAHALGVASPCNPRRQTDAGARARYRPHWRPQRIVVVYGHGGEVVREPSMPPTWPGPAGSASGHRSCGAAGAAPTSTATRADPVRRRAADRRAHPAPPDGRRRRRAPGAAHRRMDNPTGYGRILRDAAGKVTRIVEEKDASRRGAPRSAKNTGILAAPVRHPARTGSAASATTTPRASTTSPTSSAGGGRRPGGRPPCSPTPSEKPRRQ